MKRFIGVVLAMAGAVGVVWGGYHLLSGASQARLTLANNVSVDAMTGGLIGLATLVFGLVWVRD